MQTKDKLEEVVKSRNRARISYPVRSKWPELEDQLVGWIEREREKECVLTSKSIRLQALKIADEIYEDNSFLASTGWFQNFKRRKHISFRRISSSGRELGSAFIGLVQEFTRENSLLNVNRDLGSIFNMDETSIYLDFPSPYTYDKRGSKRVKAATSGHEQTRISAAFCASADGTKLPILVLLPRKTPIKVLFSTLLFLLYSYLLYSYLF